MCLVRQSLTELRGGSVKVSPSLNFRSPSKTRKTDFGFLNFPTCFNKYVGLPTLFTQGASSARKCTLSSCLSGRDGFSEETAKLASSVTPILHHRNRGSWTWKLFEQRYKTSEGPKYRILSDVAPTDSPPRKQNWRGLFNLRPSS